MKKIIYIILPCLILFSSCSKNLTYSADNFFAMDTFISVKAQTDKDTIKIIEKEILDIEKVFSKTISESDISKINKSQTAEVSKECATLLYRLSDISSATSGAFNHCMGLIISLWDITGKMNIPEDSEISALLPYCSNNAYTISDNTVTKGYLETKLDLGAAIKGYAAQTAIDKIKNAGVENAMVNIGGNIALCGHSDAFDSFWRVGITNPFNPEKIAGYIDCTDIVISVSGDYERYFEKDGIRYHHIFDVNTGKPADTDIKSVAVISADGLISDCLSTALFVMGKDKALEFYSSNIYDFEAIIFTKDKNVYVTDGIKDMFFLPENSEFTKKQ